MLSKFIKIITSDSDLNRVQDNLVASLGPALSKPILDGVQLQGVTLVSGTNTINNPLGRAILGIIPVRKSAFVDVFDQQAINQIPTKTIILQASAAATVDLWVY